MAAPPQSQPPAPAQLSLSQTAVAAPLPRTGIFRAGLGIDLLQLGPLQVFSSGGTSQGVVVGTGVEIDIGTRTALRVPLEIAYAGSSTNDAAGVEQSTVFLFAGLSPGIVYRFRWERQQRWTAYVGGAARLGGFMFGRSLLGLAPNPPPETMQEFHASGRGARGHGGPPVFTGALVLVAHLRRLHVHLRGAHERARAVGDDSAAVFVLGRVRKSPAPPRAPRPCSVRLVTRSQRGPSARQT